MAFEKISDLYFDMIKPAKQIIKEAIAAIAKGKYTNDSLSK